MKRAALLLLCSWMVVGCGGSGGGRTPDSAATDFLTADTRGISSRLDPSSGAPLPPEGSADAGAVADDARRELARTIEEADLYRVSGNLLYLLNAYRGLAVVDLARHELIGRLALPGIPVEMYLRDTRAFVFVTDPGAGTRLIEINVVDPGTPAISRSATIAGGLRTSRVVGDVLYAVTDAAVHSFLIGPSPFDPADSLPLESGADFAQATDAYAFITAPAPVPDADSGTRVTLVDISDPGGALALRGAIDLPGYVADDQKLNFGGGVLRVVTHDWVDGGLSRLFTIDVTDPEAPSVLATLELARGEQLFATRFSDDRAYLVTFLQVDPLWIIDLSDPAHPAIAGELEVPGYATQIAVDGDRLVTLGVDTESWTSEVSLFDVANPTAPRLLDREDLGDASTEALWERKAFGVFPGLVLVPSWDGLSVLARDTDTLSRRGSVTMAGGALRGFPHGTGIVAAGAEEVVISDLATLGVLGRVTIAENVVDTGRLADGRLINLVQAGNRARVGETEVPLWAEALYAFGNSAAVLGWDDAGRAAYVISFDPATPVVSERMDLGWGDWIAGAAPGATAARELAANGIATLSPLFAGPQAVLTTSGKLVTRGRPAGSTRIYGDGESFDGLNVIDIPAAQLVAGIEVRGAAVTGFTADGPALAFTIAQAAGIDDLGRPLVSERLVRVDLDTGESSGPFEVPGFVVAAQGADVFLVEEQWRHEWTWTGSVVSARIADGAAQVLDRLALPDLAYDFQAAGETLYFTESSNVVVPVLDALDASAPWMPGSVLGTVRLGDSLALGPRIEGTDAFRWLLLPEDGAALLTRDGLTVERWGVASAEATLSWSVDLAAYPLRARPDPAESGRYLLALGYAGMMALPATVTVPAGP
jgi:hypothetical protein